MASAFARLGRLIAPCLVLGGLTAATSASAVTYDCSSSDPSLWPPPSRPYFMLAIDTSGSMQNCTNPATNSDQVSCPTGFTPNSCGLEPTRLNDAKCAVQKTVEAFAGEVNFGLMTYGQRLTGCSTTGNTACKDSCTAANGNCNGYEHYSGNGCSLQDLPGGNDCGNQPTCSGGGTDALIYQGQTVATTSTPPVNGGTSVVMPGNGWHNGGTILVDMLQDPTWAPNTTPPSNLANLLAYVDGNCGDSREIFADGNTPLGGILRTAHQYYAAGWSSAWQPRTGAANPGNYCATGGPTIDHASPIDPNNDRPCRSLNVILVTDGAETCDGNSPTAAAGAATALYDVGVVVAGPPQTRIPIKTYVIGFAGALSTDLNPIADAGDDGNGTNNSTTALFANNEVQLSQALSGIISGSVRPETCDNTDNNCNGCTDEGFKTFCNRNKTSRTVAYLQNAANNPGVGDCCGGARATCLQDFANSISTSNPQGSQYWLPCWDPGTDDVNPQTKWICSDPGEVCDNNDNNCDVSIDPAKLTTNTVDEGFNKCPNCPIPETCDGRDQNCDGIIDNAPNSSVPYSVSASCKPCIPSAEICDGCDNNCDGNVDEGIPAVNCGLPTPPSCEGTKTCTPHTAATPGGYLATIGLPPGSCIGTSGTFTPCSAKGTTETCNGIDDNCDGIVDNNPTGDGKPCTPNPGDPTVGACHAGHQVCQNGAFVCVGYVGPTTEICDGVDNDCDGKIDDGVTAGVGNDCGSATGQCRKGKTACVGGTIVCQGGTQPTPETCNGVDDDCNGVADDGTLGDTPSNPGCWTTPVSGTCTTTCSFETTKWCPPAGATCTGVGTLTGVCKAGTLACRGLSGWVCTGDQGPGPETCNLLDDDCNGKVDDGLGGQTCDATIPNTPCKAGVLACVNGTQVCQGGVGPQPEICNGIDDNCDGHIDEGIGAGGTCWPDYDHTLYPGPDRQKGQCKPGILQCDGNGGQKCVGGVGPSPEVCDGLDNDCDGQIDESGAPPDGINGTADPQNPAQSIGQPCGSSVGACKPGTLGCVAGRTVCTGAIGPGPELCDCIDNDCDGQIDEDPSPTEQPLCATGQTCVQKSAGGICQCAPPCSPGEFPCPSGQECLNVNRSGTSTPAPAPVCIGADPCGDCSTKTVKKSDSTIECEPATVASSSSRPIPVCVCKGANGCHAPCFNAATCPTQGQQCAPLDGTCQDQNNCFFFGCPTGQVCTANKVCVDDPCNPNPCPAGQECKPNGTFTGHSCVPSCANVTCAANQVCEEGACQPTGCAAACPSGQYCQPATTDGGTGACGPSKCTATTCPGGEYCDPATGRCGSDPCEGVACPSGQICQAGSCVTPPTMPGSGGSSGSDGGNMTGTGGGGAQATGGGTATGGSAGSSGQGATNNGGPPPKEAFGLASGGGGCACSVPTESHPERHGLAAGLAVLALFGVRRKRRSPARAAGGSR